MLEEATAASSPLALLSEELRSYGDSGSVLSLGESAFWPCGFVLCVLSALKDFLN